jgi:hypothetical protein
MQSSIHLFSVASNELISFSSERTSTAGRCFPESMVKAALAPMDIWLTFNFPKELAAITVSTPAIIVMIPSSVLLLMKLRISSVPLAKAGSS